MIAIQLLQVKDFMNKLLRTDLFDHFLLSEATIRGKGSYEIDGHLVPDFYSPEELDELELTGLSCLPFGMLRESRSRPRRLSFSSNGASLIAFVFSGISPSRISGIRYVFLYLL